ncbi:MAG: helix-hairpin-helix domain-containing protein [Bacteroidales bacterium]|nr:helix-hairpin-helix domain-containing protein [Bacteroidales bacterium]
MKRRADVGKEEKTSSHSRITASFKAGAIALAFLVIGYQSALFIRSAAVARLVSHRDAPDTVFVIDESLARRLISEDSAQPSSSTSSPSSSLPSSGSSSSSPGQASHGRSSSPSGLPFSGTSSPPPDQPTSESGRRVIVRRNAPHSAAADAVVATAIPRRTESFPFNPNTVSLSDLQRLGFSERQAQSIINYREKGGRFHRPSDFAKSFVVSDSVYHRLEPYIRIPKVDLNAADSTALDALPGIGPYYAAKILEYRSSLCGFSYPEQLMDIHRFDKDKFDALKDLVTVGPSEPYPLWALPEDELRRHPYIDSGAAHGIVLYREHNPSERWTVDGLKAAGVLRPADADRLARCRIAAP